MKKQRLTPAGQELAREYRAYEAREHDRKATLRQALVVTISVCALWLAIGFSWGLLVGLRRVEAQRRDYLQSVVQYHQLLMEQQELVYKLGPGTYTSTRGQLQTLTFRLLDYTGEDINRWQGKGEK